MQLFPTTRSPRHHGTDPDLSAPTPLPAGVALAGLDLTPLTAGSCSSAVAARKPRSLKAGALSSFKPLRLGRGSSADRKVVPNAKRPDSHERSGGRPQQGHSSSYTKTAGPSHAVPGPVRGSADCQQAASIHLRHSPAGSSARDHAAGGKPASFLRNDSSDERYAGQPSEPPRLKPSPCGVKRDGCFPRVPENEGQVEVAKQQQHQQESTKKSLETLMAKAKVASDNIRLLLHAKRCQDLCCKEPGCSSARQLVEHMRFCPGSSVKPCGYSKCRQANKILLHYTECR